MAQFTITVISNITATPLPVYRGSERGRLKSVSAYFIGTPLELGLTYVVVGVSSSGESLENIVGVFCEGYISKRHFVYWVGDYPLEAYEQIWCLVYGRVARTVRISGKIEIGDC